VTFPLTRKWSFGHSLKSIMKCFVCMAASSEQHATIEEEGSRQGEEGCQGHQAVGREREGGRCYAVAGDRDQSAAAAAG
jgi:hypothetical protein